MACGAFINIFAVQAVTQLVACGAFITIVAVQVVTRKTDIVDTNVRAMGISGSFIFMARVLVEETFIIVIASEVIAMVTDLAFTPVAGIEVDAYRQL